MCIFHNLTQADDQLKTSVSFKILRNVVLHGSMSLIIFNLSTALYFPFNFQLNRGPDDTYCIPQSVYHMNTWDLLFSISTHFLVKLKYKSLLVIIKCNAWNRNLNGRQENLHMYEMVHPYIYYLLLDVHVFT